MFAGDLNSLTRSIFKVTYYLKVHNAHLKLALPIEVFRNSQSWYFYWHFLYCLKYENELEIVASDINVNSGSL